MLSKFIIFIFLILFHSGNAFCQQYYGSYQKIIQKNKIGRTYVDQSKTDTVWRTYLGILFDTSATVNYHVISEFKKIRAASTWNGQSNVYLLNKQGKIVWSILIGMPDELPIKLEANSFYFKEGKKIVSARFGVVNNQLFCVHPRRCYEVVQNQ